MLDSNVLFSAFYLKDSAIANMVKFIKTNHTIVLCNCIITETKENFLEKYPDKYQKLDEYLDSIYDELYDLENIDLKKYPNIRDIDDIEILATAIETNVDILITGDTDFHTVYINKPNILTPKQFRDKYIKY